MLVSASVESPASIYDVPEGDVCWLGCGCQLRALNPKRDVDTWDIEADDHSYYEEPIARRFALEKQCFTVRCFLLPSERADGAQVKLGNQDNELLRWDCFLSVLVDQMAA